MSEAALQSRLGHRVADAAQRALADHGYVTPLEVLVGLRWLHDTHPRLWRQERIATIEEIVQVDLAVRLAVRASVRHQDTDYDRRLMRGEERAEARDSVERQVARVLERWSAGAPGSSL